MTADNYFCPDCGSTTPGVHTWAGGGHCPALDGVEGVAGATIAALRADPDDVLRRLTQCEMDLEATVANCEAWSMRCEELRKKADAAEAEVERLTAERGTAIFADQHEDKAIAAAARDYVAAYNERERVYVPSRAGKEWREARDRCAALLDVLFASVEGK